MVVMALDHMRDMLHTSSITQSPTDLSSTTPALFFTRWVTHLCAPVFVYLAGVSSYFSLQNAGNTCTARWFLVKRGLWLMLLEFTIVGFGLFFDPGFHTLMFEVIATTGIGLIVLGILSRLPIRFVLMLGLLIIALYGIFFIIPFGKGSIVQAWLQPLFAPGVFPLPGGRVFVMAYPPLPWLGILLTGFGTAQLFLLPLAQQKRRFMLMGMMAVILFIVTNFQQDTWSLNPRRNWGYVFGLAILLVLSILYAAQTSTFLYLQF